MPFRSALFLKIAIDIVNNFGCKSCISSLQCEMQEAVRCLYVYGEGGKLVRSGLKALSRCVCLWKKGCCYRLWGSVKSYAAVIIGTRVRQRMKGSATRSSYFLTRRRNDWSFWTAKMLHKKKSRPWGWDDSQRTGEQAYPLFVLVEMLMKKLSGIVGKIYE